MENDDFISLDEVESDLRIAGLKMRRSTVRRWLCRGIGGLRLRGFKVGRRWHIRLNDLFEFFQGLGDRRLSKTKPAQAGQSDVAGARLRSALRERGLL